MDPASRVFRKSFNLEPQLASLENEHNNLTYSSRLLWDTNKTMNVGSPKTNFEGLIWLLAFTEH